MIIITGVSGYIGGELFGYYLQTDKSVLGTYNNKKPKVICPGSLFQVDISDFVQVQKFVELTKNELKKICLINCASITYDSFAHKSDPEQWKNVIDINLTGTYNMIRALLPIMREQKFGRIINLSSVVAQKGTLGTSAYAASKAGLWGLSKAIAVENAKLNVLINSINLGYLKSGMTDRIPTELKNDIIKNIPVNSFGDIHEIILAIDHLINSNYITGASMDINGGLL